jgi:hypothetical protein
MPGRSRLAAVADEARRFFDELWSELELEVLTSLPRRAERALPARDRPIIL